MAVSTRLRSSIETAAVEKGALFLLFSEAFCRCAMFADQKRILLFSFFRLPLPVDAFSIRRRYHTFINLQLFERYPLSQWR